VADAACAATQVSTPDNKPAHSAVDFRLGSLTLTLAIIEPRLHSKIELRFNKIAKPKS